MWLRQPRKYTQSVWKREVEQNNDLRNGEPLLGGAAEESVNKCEEENAEQYAIRQIKYPTSM